MKMQTLRPVARFGAVAILLLAAAPSASAQPEQLTGDGAASAIRPMTRFGPWPQGYMADPQPIHLAGPEAAGAQMVSGTTKALLRCAGPVRPECFSWTPITVDASALRDQIAAAGPGAHMTNLQNTDLFQDDGGGWHAVVTVGVATAEHPQHWTVVTHAHPLDQAAPGEAPHAWAVDTVIAGSFQDPVDGNYDAKFYEDDGRLYLLYVKNFVPRPALRNEIVIQPMLSPTRPAPVEPMVLLAPGDRQGPLNSEWYANTQAKLVEAPYISRIGGKYALVYSTGAYLTPTYKVGVAWSDTLLPRGGLHYRKVLQPDGGRVWGSPGSLEVRYLLQSQKPAWPNFVGDRVVAPGVAAAVLGADGVWRLDFAGFDPDDMPKARNGQVDGTHRRPYFARLRVAVPPARPLATVSDAELAGWMQVEPQ